MESHAHHNHHSSHHEMTEHTSHQHSGEKEQSVFSLSVSATFHCLIGCGIGEVVGMIIGTYYGMSMMETTILAVILGFIAGMALGILPLLRSRFTLQNALKTVFVGEGLSIAVMEAFEVGTQFAIPGVMEAGLTDGIFWIGMFAALAVGFVAALPVNIIMIKRGVRHIH
ncbi:MAG: DUF4396 domain-containing protein [Ignavibacteriales bacterium]|nr:DUF4396 domain-containing protein [Ignavibacteriales bacterium]